MRYGNILAAVALAACASLGSTTALAAPFVFQLEGGTVDKKDTYDDPTWDLVNLKYAYENPVILAIPNTNGNNPADFRVRNVTQTAFELTLVEPPSEDGPHVDMKIAYVAVEAGVFQLPDSRLVAAGFADTKQVVYKNGGGFVTVPLPAGFTNPIVLSQIQGQANEANSIPSAPSSPWVVASVRNVTNTSFDLALDGCECFSGSLALPERVGWMAIDGNVTGQFVDDDGIGIVYETIRTGNTIDGWDNAGAFVSFGQAYGSTPLFVAKLQTRNNQDGGWPRYSNLSTSGVTLAVDEDRCQDNERQHPGESAGLFVFSTSFRVKDEDPDKDGFASSVDNCPLIWNPTQADVDGDGQGDACDCGDGKLGAMGEVCDDGDAAGGDGCSATCQVEPGWQCTGEPSLCTPVCGDGLIVGGEGCDDGGLLGGDGCSATCAVELGWSCSGQPSICAPGCGDGLVVGGEECDDGNNLDGDGCSGACTIEIAGTGGSGQGGSGQGGSGGGAGGEGGSSGGSSRGRAAWIPLYGRSCSCSMPEDGPAPAAWVLAVCAAWGLRRRRRDGRAPARRRRAS